MPTIVLSLCMWELPAPVRQHVSKLDLRLTFGGQVMDNLLSSLSKYTAMLSPSGNKPVVEFGNSEKGRLACETSFQLANRCARGMR